ncbi:Uncharacterised protein [Vibrio cholerae]|nr:Uncharacterised protein [Vibrio cholerae]
MSFNERIGKRGSPASIPCNCMATLPAATPPYSTNTRIIAITLSINAATSSCLPWLNASMIFKYNGAA